MIGELLSEVCGRVGLGFVLAWFELCVLLKLWKTVAGKLLKCVRTVNSIELAAHDLGEKYHKASSEPLFCETAYLPVKRDSAVAVDELGRCCIANEIGQHNAKTNHPEMWECTKECKALTDDEVASIFSLKIFTQPMKISARL